MPRDKERDRSTFPGRTQFLQGCGPHAAALRATLCLAASSKQTSEQSRCPDILYKHRGETITRKIQSRGVPAINCLGLGQTWAWLLHLLFQRGGLQCHVWGFGCCREGGWYLGASMAQERGQEVLMDAQEMLIWRSDPSSGGFKTIWSNEVCTHHCWKREGGPGSSWGNAVITPVCASVSPVAQKTEHPASS